MHEDEPEGDDEWQPVAEDRDRRLDGELGDRGQDREHDHRGRDVQAAGEAEEGC
ncbi:hypothetical protein [Naasia aerilata]|uniref:Uncharacterized protein n=1 Tax=Naasia aerilata TaxID=1162966 RepID=A0ABM8GGL6_9MICO|nr:hypothetical protein [Naasia aerilata]BDZ47501.1 hypothetical protein GCM10025866_34100 [Naasia aerilata]